MKLKKTTVNAIISYGIVIVAFILCQAMIEAKAAVLTPVDTGLLRRANEYHVAELSGYGRDEVTLTIENRMVYAHYQHENVLHHNQPKARDHFISIPFEDELTPIVDEIVQADLQEART